MENSADEETVAMEKLEFEIENVLNILFKRIDENSSLKDLCYSCDFLRFDLLEIDNKRGLAHYIQCCYFDDEEEVHLINQCKLVFIYGRTYIALRYSFDSNVSTIFHARICASFIEAVEFFA